MKHPMTYQSKKEAEYDEQGNTDEAVTFLWRDS
jgi:hypothetical protein